MDRLEFLKAQPWLDEVASDEWPASGELFAGTCVLELVGDVGTSPLAAQLHFRSGLLGSSTQTGVRLALQRSETPAAAAAGAGAKRTRDDGAPPAAPARGARLLATFEASGRTCVAHLRHTQIRRMTDNSAAASEQRDVPYLRLEFDHVALVLRALPELSLTAAAEQLRRTMACMLQELPRGPAGAAVSSRPRTAGGAAAESPPPPPSDDELALALDARVESWQAFVRCAQHLAAQVRARGGGGGAGGGAGASAGGGADSDAAAAAPAIDEALVSALPRLLGEALAPPSATLVAAAQQRRAAFDRQRDAYAQLVVGQLSRGASAAAEPPPPAEAVEAKRQRARDDLEAAYAAALSARAGLMLGAP